MCETKVVRIKEHCQLCFHYLTSPNLHCLASVLYSFENLAIMQVIQGKVNKYFFSKIGCTYSKNPLGKIYNITENFLCTKVLEGNVCCTTARFSYDMIQELKLR